MRVGFHRPPGRLGFTVAPAKLVALRLARARRRRLGRTTTFVAIRGSAGKTTTTRLLDAVLATRGPVAVAPHAVPRLRADQDDDTAVVHFDGAAEAEAFLRGELGHGDVVLLKADHTPEELERIALASIRRVACRRVRCTKRVFCDDCRLLATGMGNGG